MPTSDTQTKSPQSAQLNDLGSGIVVKDLDGSMKVLNDGELKELDSMLSDSQVSDTPERPDINTETHELVPMFTDNAPIPEHDTFKEPEKDASIKGSEVATMHFHGDDKTDLDAELNKIQHVYDVDAQKKYSIEKIAKKLADKHALKLSEDKFEQFNSLLLSFFRQARNKVDTTSKMTEKENGGLGLKQADAEHIITIAANLKDKIEEHDGVVVDSRKKTPAQSVPLLPPVQPQPPIATPKVKESSAPAPMPAPEEKKEAPVQPAPQPVPEHKRGKRPMMPFLTNAKSPVTEKIEEKEEPVTVPEKDTNQEVEATPDEPLTPKESVEKESAKVKTESVAQPPKESSPLISPVIEQQQQTSSIPKVTRPSSAGKMQDVKAKRGKQGGLTGRIDELAQMDLQTWRLLDQNPRIRAGKILGKIQNLQQESFLRRSQGLDAWRGSETYQHYLRLGQMSLEQGKDVSQIIKEVSDGGEDTLTLDEFEAISDLNRTLRY